jgi:hypothetical protein
MAFTYSLAYGAHRLAIDVVGDELRLSLDGVVRKRRSAAGDSCVYVWTNVELDWEEHHFIEGRWWPATGRVLLTTNGKTLLDHACSATQG